MSGCQARENLDSGAANQPAVSIEANVIYGHKAGMALTYDVFTPAAANQAGIIYMVSGGWFSRWQPAEQRRVRFKSLLDAGFTVFAVHHGSAPQFKVPEAVSDVRAAVRHIKKHADRYAVDPARLGVTGGSAGGHLSLMLGLDPEGTPVSGEGWLRSHYHVSDDDDARVAAVVAYYPPTDIRSIVGPSRRFPALDFDSALAASISPVLFATEDDPPIKLIHGTQDDLVPLQTSLNLQKALKSAGVVHDLLVIEGGDHGFRTPAHRAEAGAASLAWFKQYLLASEQE